MKYGISNIGWADPFDKSVLKILSQAGIQGIEVAPTKFFPGWAGINAASLKEVRKKLEDQGFLIPSMQSLFFGVSGLESVFKSETQILQHLELVSDVGAALGAKVLVFGSPKLRLKHGTEQDLLEIFRKAGDICRKKGVTLGLEANPVEYGGEFWFDNVEVQNFVKELSHPAIAFHFDSGALAMTNYTITEHPAPVHFHLSAPKLVRLDQGQLDYAEIDRIIKNFDYNSWCVIEMLTTPAEELESISAAIKLMKDRF